MNFKDQISLKADSSSAILVEPGTSLLSYSQQPYIVLSIVIRKAQNKNII